jgi:hypothetical protein
MTPSTPPEERDQREKTVSTTVEGIRTLEEECAKLYEDNTKVWNQLSEDVELQSIEQKLQTVQGKAKKIKETISSFPPAEKMMTMQESKKLYAEMNQLRVEQQARMQQIEMLQEEALKVAEEISEAQCRIKQAVEQAEEK